MGKRQQLPSDIADLMLELQSRKKVRWLSSSKSELTMNLNVTDRAKNELRTIFADQNMPPETTYARLAVQGGGCSGFQHRFMIDENYNEKLDIIVEFDGIKFVVDRRSALYLEGTTVDFHDDLNKRGFKFTNPSIKTTCGCGSSFNL